MATAFQTYNVSPNPNDGVNGIVPVGSLMMWSTATAPSQWLLCDGTAVSRSLFAPLFNVIGTTYGVGDGSTTFNVPDMRGRLPRGVNGTYALASTGGADTITLAANQLPNHSHSITDNGHSHNFSQGGQQAAPGTTWRAGDPNTGAVPTSTNTTGITINNSLTVSGVQQTQVATNIVNPYLAINYIIKSS